jgi:SAM-dependent methyltransferase
MDVRSYNRVAWDLEVERGNPWTVPVTSDVVAAARAGDVRVKLTPTADVPASWSPPLRGRRVLCLAGGGGQQGPLFAAAGAEVTVVDNAPRQLAQDRAVAAREGLALTTIEADMADLGALASASFDLVFNPCSTCFVPDVRPVWREAARVLRPGGTLMTGFLNPVVYQVDKEREAKERLLVLRYAQPYSDLTSLTESERARYASYHAPLEFGHALADQIGGQLAVGFALTGFYEDRWDGREVADALLPSFFATRAVLGPRG